MRSYDERRKFEGDVIYEVWLSGGNPDAVDYDRLDDYWYDGLDAYEASERELQIQRRNRYHG